MKTCTGVDDFTGMPTKEKSSKTVSAKRPENAHAMNETESRSPTSMNGGTPTFLAMEAAVEQRTSSPEHEAQDDPKIKAEQLKEKGNTFFKERSYTEAVDLYSQAIALQPSEPTYLTNRAASYMALKRFDQALADCKQAASLQSETPSPRTLVRLARCQLATGSSGPALLVLREALVIDPENASAKQLQAKLLELEAHLRNFKAAQSRKEWLMALLALDNCERTIKSEGGCVSTEWRCWRIEIELARGNLDAASIAANEALQLDSNSADVMALRGLVLFLTARLPDALDHAIQALRFDPDNALAKRIRQRVKAVERLKDEGNTNFKSNQWQAAIDKYSEAIGIIGDSPEEGRGGLIRATLLSNRATSFVKLDRHEEALFDIEESLELNPNSFKALRTRARIRVQLEEYDAAVADFKSALECAASKGSEADKRSIKLELRKAMADLRRSKRKDYYKILGLSADCTDADVKKAYRRESLKHHPDKGGDEEKFKLAVEAHSVLSDPVKREQYDMEANVDDYRADDYEGVGEVDIADIIRASFRRFNAAEPHFRSAAV